MHDSQYSPLVVELWCFPIELTSHNCHIQNMVQIALVDFLPDDHGQKCEAHPFGCGNAFIQQQGNGVGMLVRLRRVEVTHLAGYNVRDDGTDGWHVCFAAHEYATGPNVQLLDGALLCITEVFLPDTANMSMWALYYRNCGYAYVEIVENWVCMLTLKYDNTLMDDNIVDRGWELM